MKAASSAALVGRPRAGAGDRRGNVRGSTLRLRLASVLADELGLQLVGPKNIGRNAEGRLSQWMRDHLAVAVHPFEHRDALADLERGVLGELNPPLNLEGRPASETERRSPGCGPVRPSHSSAIAPPPVVLGEPSRCQRESSLTRCGSVQLSPAPSRVTGQPVLRRPVELRPSSTGQGVIGTQASESNRAIGASRRRWTLSATFRRTSVVSAAAGSRNAGREGRSRDDAETLGTPVRISAFSRTANNACGTAIAKR